MVTTTPTHFKVKVNTSKGSSYWTLSGSTTIIEDAAVFTMDSMPDFFRQSLKQDFIELLAIE
ncbi:MULTISPECIES: hypothetical protein [unclassified Aliivibrio]|jgi:hypothetical protein|uniref:hypothetical protein n=1 Tax=unclassified Aliivibrio TaxID=2645654 RepID=UPI00080E31F6|nr:MULTISPECIES: hypothetical protein [unclassified Aliivibrio]OCH16657.1 hypothetical protein A6E05_02150 [Aliivibrio sp. 1S165]OCH21472.1 hypothetical protein A6E03_09395 [Aliivibrio sp. 1S128]OCH32890.1 hypothetical protein A6E06_02315 [Aliivibrio sp. 1S175]